MLSNVEHRPSCQYECLVGCTKLVAGSYWACTKYSHKNLEFWIAFCHIVMLLTIRLVGACAEILKERKILQVCVLILVCMRSYIFERC